MIKRVWGIVLFGILLTYTSLCFAGSIPEDLLHSDSAQVYFGEVVKVDGEYITVIQQKNIKGEFLKDKEITYHNFAFTSSPGVGKTYICGYFDENNPLYVWESTGLDTKTLKIKNTDELSQRMQKYLNNGLFDEKEKERLAAKGVTTAAEGSEQTADADLSASDGYKTYAIGVLALAGAAAVVWGIIKGRKRR